MTRKRIPPATRQARAYAADDPRYERNARLRALEDQQVQAPVAQPTPPAGTNDPIVVAGDSELAVQVGGTAVGDCTTLDFVAGTNVAIAGQAVPAQGKVILTFTASGGGAGAWDFDEGDASIVYSLGDFDFDGGGA